MHEHIEDIVDKIRIPFVGLLVAASCVLLYFILSAGTATGGTSMSSGSVVLSDDPNAVTGALSTMAEQAGRALDVATNNMSKGLRGVGKTTAHTGTVVAGSGRAIGHGVVSVLVFSGRMVGTCAAFIVHIPLAVAGSVTTTPVMSAVITPSRAMTVPTIEPERTIAAAPYATAVEVQPTAQKAVITTEPTVVWPVHGKITTEFGVPEWPYQPIHTGIDISDGWNIGVTPVKSFKQGKVIQIVRSSVGLGNHVVVDHGNGMTSVYGHLFSVSVIEGQDVDTNTALGTEGSTGASTGPHVHFEIRMNGIAVNPHLYITGQP